MIKPGEWMFLTNLGSTSLNDLPVRILEVNDTRHGPVYKVVLLDTNSPGWRIGDTIDVNEFELKPSKGG